MHRGYYHSGRMQGLGLLISHSEKNWVFGYFRNNNIVTEFERGTNLKSIPSFKTLEASYKQFINKEEELNDLRYID